MRRPPIRYLLLALGLLSLTLGSIGLFVPVLPTTPFLLVSAFCFLRSSDRLYHWLLNHRIFGVFIYNYITYKAVPRATKIGAIVFLWATLGVSIAWVDAAALRLLLVGIGIAVTIHLGLLKTIPRS